MLIDINNLGFAAQSSTVLRIGDQQTQAIYGVLRSIRMFAARFPQYTPMALWDGQTWRKNAFEAYKANRDAPPKNKHEIAQRESRAEYRRQKVHIERALEFLGVRQVFSANLEADDLAAMFCRASKDERRIILLSGDKDWVQLITPKISWINPIGKPQVITPRKLKEALGVETPQAWLEVKAIQGDVSDNVSGVGGIGAKGAIDLVKTYGSVASFLNAVIFDKTVSYDSLPKKLQAFVEDQEKQAIFHRNLSLMDLNHPAVPKPIDLVHVKGEFSPDKFAGLCREFSFKSILNDLDDWLEPFTSERSANRKAA
jgi:5'-3' exonuclease